MLRAQAMNTQEHTNKQTNRHTQMSRTLAHLVIQRQLHELGRRLHRQPHLSYRTSSNPHTSYMLSHFVLSHVCEAQSSHVDHMCNHKPRAASNALARHRSLPRHHHAKRRSRRLHHTRTSGSDELCAPAGSFRARAHRHAAAPLTRRRPFRQPCTWR